MLNRTGVKKLDNKDSRNFLIMCGVLFLDFTLPLILGLFFKNPFAFTDSSQDINAYHGYWFWWAIVNVSIATVLLVCAFLLSIKLLMCTIWFALKNLREEK
jgi:hypothetical protein